MPSPRFPAMATLLDAKECPLVRFDALFAKITEERRILDGYFLQAHPDETQLLFVVNGAPFGAGRVAGGTRAFLEIHEFFAAYSRHPASPLSFLVADKRLLLGLMVLFRHQPTRTFRTDLAEVGEILQQLTARGGDAIVGIGSEEEWAVSLWTKGKATANYFPPSGAAALKQPTPQEQLLAYVMLQPAGGVGVEIFEETRVTPAGDATLVTPETRGRLSEVFLKVAFQVQEAETAPRLEMETTPEPTLVTPRADAALPTAPAAPPSFKGPVPEVLLFLGDRQLGTFSLAQGELTIGRTPGNAILIDNPGVSRRHAVIRATGDRVVLEDLGSANGTFVRGEKITSRDLQDGDEITVVKHRLVFRVPKRGEPAAKADLAMDAGQKTMYIDPAAVAQAMAGRPGTKPESAAPVLRPRLILPDLKKFGLEAEEITLGSGADCQIQLSGMFVAKAHARIIPQKDGQYKLVHLAGLAGTRVNGEKIAEHILKHGDEIEISKQRLLFRLER